MSLASPDRLMWLLVALPIIGFYILKTRLRRRPVATLLFWDQLFEEKRQRSLWQNLRHWLSLLLQLLLVALLGFALADPLWRSQTNSGQELILIVDNSASMQAVDPGTGRCRLDEAIDRAADVAAGLRQGDSIALITAGNSVRVVVGMTDFAPAIEDALRTIPPTDGPTRVEDAIEAARRLANDPQRRRIVVFSDACLPAHDSSPPSDEADESLADVSTIPTADDLRWVQVGTSRDNVAITTFQVRRSTVDPIGYALLIEVRNFSDQAVEGRLKLELNESLVDVLPYSLDPNERLRKTIDGTSREGGVLTGSIDAADGLSADNTARAIVPARPLIPVTLVTEGESESFYLRTVLESIPLIELTVIDAAAGVDLPDAPNSLTVLSGTTPKRLPAGPTLIVAPRQNGPPLDADSDGTAWTIGESIESPIIAKQDKDSPLLRHVNLQNVILDGGRDIEFNEAVGQPQTLLETAAGARVLVSVERASGRILILTADLETSDLPLRIAFPVMISNAMNWFFRETGEMNPALKTGQITSVPWDVAEGSDGEATLIDPDGNRRPVTVDQASASLGPIGHTGVFGLFAPSTLPQENNRDQEEDDAIEKTPKSPRGLLTQSGDVKGTLLAVNLCDADESDLRIPPLSPQTSGDLPPGGAPPWFYLVLLGIGLVIGEWVLFNRRVVA